MTTRQLNNISTLRILNKFTNKYYFEIAVDGKALDVLLNEAYPEDNMLGLVPTLLDWLENKEERKVTWDRIIPKENETIISPILMCSDDLDFSCTIIVAEATCKDNIVYWHRLGIDNSDERDFKPETVGQKTNWLDKIPAWQFDKQQFLDCVEQFRTALEKTNA